jgi:hypothetical protein
MDAGTLHSAIVEVCPVDIVTIGKSNDRATWTFEPSPSATQAQIDAGQNVIDTIPVDYKRPPVPDPQSEVLYLHENRLRLLEGQPPLSLTDFLMRLTHAR